MAQFKSFEDRLKEGLEGVEKLMMELLDHSTIAEFRNDPSSGVVFAWPPYYWGSADDIQQRLQLKLKAAYSNWFEQFRLLFRNAPAKIQKQVEEVDAFVIQWIERNSTDWSVQASIPHCKARFSDRLSAFYGLIDLSGHELKIRSF